MKPSLPQGTRDFSSAVLKKRNYIFGVIRNVFELYGFEPLETPAMENIETLMGKYGEEGDKLIFKILNNGLHLPEKHSNAQRDFEQVLQGKTSKGISERALRYDLTIPFARYVAMNQGQLTFPFKRYQMQPVWRADRPQRGRYREFYQCDADIAGSSSLLHEIELALIYSTVFNNLQLPVEIHINNRKILQALAEKCGGTSHMMNITIAIDKLDKIGMDKVKQELRERGLNEERVALVEKYISIKGDNQTSIQQLSTLLGDIESAKDGINEILEILQAVNQTMPSTKICVCPSLARGLNYYTGTIFEVKAVGVEMGSIGGGGRYDDLTGLFGVKGIAGVGISFGVDRIYDVLEELNAFPEHLQAGTTALIFNTGIDKSHLINVASLLRNHHISCEIFHEAVKFDKQFKYAEKKQIPFIIIIGDEELAKNTVTVKNLKTGKQDSIAPASLPSMLSL
ncbi:MAG: histidine--tRNA ligase [Bacteroidetes bacterium]|nr:histidine--tRNA ligase [Bacteroidota bacterium]